MTWIELVQEYVEAAGHSMDAVREAGYVGDALWEIGSIWDRASEAQEFPDSEAPELDDSTGLLVEARIDEVLLQMMNDRGGISDGGI